MKNSVEQRISIDLLRTFARKSSHIEICFISRLKLDHKLLITKMKNNCGVTDFFSEKKAREECPNFDRYIVHVGDHNGM